MKAQVAPIRSTFSAYSWYKDTINIQRAQDARASRAGTVGWRAGSPAIPVRALRGCWLARTGLTGEGKRARDAPCLQPRRSGGGERAEKPGGGWADRFSFARAPPSCAWQANVWALQLLGECVTLEVGERGIFTKVPFSTAKAGSRSVGARGTGFPHYTVREIARTFPTGRLVCACAGYPHRAGRHKHPAVSFLMGWEGCWSQRRGWKEGVCGGGCLLEWIGCSNKTPRKWV